MSNMKNRKGQEEIVGFVVIVVLVSVVLVVFLGIFIRQDSSIGETETVELFQFLESSMEYTSGCAISYEPDYSKLRDLIGECYTGISICTSREKPCDVLNKTLNEMLDSSFFADPEGSVKGYEFKIDYSNNITDIPEEILLIKDGNCSSGIIRGSEILTSAYPGTIISSLKLCF